MLSETNTISDIKSKLFNDYDFFNYEIESDFDNALESVCDDVMRIYFYPRIGETNYSLIADKDKEDLSSYETNLYWAEIFTVCYEFLRMRSAIENQMQSSGNEKLSVEGYRYEVTGGGGSSLNDLSAGEYYNRMYSYWKLAGFNLSSLERTCTIFGDSRYTGEEPGILE